MPVRVKTGLVSSGETEIVSGDISENDEVVNGTAEAGARDVKAPGAGGSNQGNPFMPKFPQRRNRNLNPGRTQQGNNARPAR